MPNFEKRFLCPSLVPDHSSSLSGATWYWPWATLNSTDLVDWPSATRYYALALLVRWFLPHCCHACRVRIGLPRQCFAAHFLTAWPASNRHDQHVGEALLICWLCAYDAVAGIVLCCWRGCNHNGLCLPFWAMGKDGNAKRETETSRNDFSIPCNFLINALIYKISAALCSRQTNVQLTSSSQILDSGAFCSWNFTQPCLCLSHLLMCQRCCCPKRALKSRCGFVNVHWVFIL